ncbi:Glutamyl aminopeptidase [Orchesella cincta]|uniref:Glutamyl aminopeptidase n=1 Tax=Orchesella cincta TaxID=48709 RepID=A0A1D2N0D9_ORCCI|nr:Glutamyl aminopeptidase [Orchesella cincta]
MRDLFSLANGNYSEDFSLALEFAQILKGETEFLLWDCADGHLRKIGKLLRKTSPEVYPTYQKYMQSLVEKAYDSLEWKDTEDEDLMKRLIKPKIISLACEFELQKCRQQASELLNASLESPENVLGGFRDVVYKWGMYQADNATWQLVWQRYMNEQDPQERVRLLRGLASIQNAELITQLLELSQDDKIVRKQDYFGVLKYIGQNPIGNPIVWNFYKNEYMKLSEKFGIDNKYFGRVIQDLTTEFSNEDELKEVLELFEKYPNGGAGTNARKYAVENIINNIHWRSAHSSKVEEWLKNF